MCGRAAQSVGAVNAAGQLLTSGGGGGGGNLRRLRGGGGNDNEHSWNDKDDEDKEILSQDNDKGEDCSMPMTLGEEEEEEESDKRTDSDGGKTTTTTTTATVKDFDNMNLCPGMLASVFCRKSCLSGDANNDKKPSSFQESPICRDMFWGLVLRGGTSSTPLPVGNLSLHFEMLMYNARSDTLMDKRTFRELLLQQQSCIVAVDGYYEWKAPRADTYDTSKTKQPYYVHRTDGQPLLIAGLWTSVPTGRSNANGKEMLSTFTMITTDACAKLQDLHHRMPVLVWNLDLARQWISNPTPELHRELSRWSSTTTTHPQELHLHPVTKQMTSLKFRNYEECTKEIPLPTIASVKSFFKTSTRSKSRGVSSSSAAFHTTPPKGATTTDQRTRKRSGSFAQEEVASEKKDTDNHTRTGSSKHQERGKLSSPLRRSLSHTSSPPAAKSARTAAHSTKKRISTSAPPKKKDITSFFAPRPKK